MVTDRRRLRHFALRIVAVVTLAGCDSGNTDPATPRVNVKPASLPDIVLVSIDSLRHDHLGCYGYGKPTSPRIDALAAQGVRFENAVSTTSWTLPAHAALFTGLFDSAHGLVDNGLTMSDRVVTLAEVLQDAGYRTAGFYGGPYLHPTYGLDQGFETYVSCMTTIEDSLRQDEVRAIAEGDTNVSHRDVTGPRTLEAVRGFLESDDDRPMFLFLHLWDVHYDYMPPADIVRLFDPDYSGPLTGSDMMHDPGVHAGMPPRDLQHLLALYDGEIRFTDDVLGQILDAIAQRRGLDDTIVIVTADHGEEFFEHGHKGHQQSLYDEVVRIPLIVRWPGRIDAGRVVEDQVRIIDVLPTVLTLAGVPGPNTVQGRDLGPLLLGQALPPEPALCDLSVTGMRELHAVRTNDSKYVSFPTPHWWQVGYQYFDLERDPGETTRLPMWSSGWLDSRRTLARLRRESQETSRRLGETVLPAEPLDDEMLQRLRSLGYVGD